MICPQCNTYSESNFCPNCGKKLKLALKTRGQMQYLEYRRYYPDKCAGVVAGVGLYAVIKSILNLTKEWE